MEFIDNSILSKCDSDDKTITKTSEDNQMVDMSDLNIITTCQKLLTRIIPYLMTVKNILKQLKSKFIQLIVTIVLLRQFF